MTAEEAQTKATPAAQPVSQDGVLRFDWTVEQARALHDLPLFELIDRSRAVHVKEQPKDEVQLCTLLSVKTGGCEENCSYCSQSSHHQTVKTEPLLKVEDVLEAARKSKEAGSTRFCMGAAWRGVKDGRGFDRVLEMIRGVKGMGLEACVTLGMINEEQAMRLKEAGLDSYNHNIDTSREFYTQIVTTREFEDRLTTLRHVRKAGISVCSGGIIGLGESIDDRCAMLVELARLNPQPESVPVNALVRVKGTPLESLPPIEAVELVRMVALARLMMPKAKVRLSAGRSELSTEAQLLCMYSGANSIFYGDHLLTTPNPEENDDRDLIAKAGLKPQAPAPSPLPAE